MRPPALLALTAALALWGGSTVQADPVPAAVVADPPPDAAHPPADRAVTVGQGGLRTVAVLRRAAGPAPHPVVLMLADAAPGGGLDDLAEAARRDGWDVLTPDPRGAGASSGSFSFTHALEDVRTAIAWLRAPDGGVAEGGDPNKIVIVGQGIGAWRAAEAAAEDPRVIGVALLSLEDLGAEGALPGAALDQAVAARIAQAAGARGLGTAAPDALAEELRRNSPRWRTSVAAAALKGRPVLLVSPEGGPEAAGAALAQALGSQDPGALTQVRIGADPSYSGSRIALAAALLRWLENLPGAPAGI